LTVELPRINDSDTDSNCLGDSPEAVAWIKDSSDVHIASPTIRLDTNSRSSPPPPSIHSVPDTITSPTVEVLDTDPVSSPEIPAFQVTTPTLSPPSSFLYPPEQSQPIDRINCPCCEKTMSVNHACDNNSEDSLVLDKLDYDTCTTSAPVPNFSPHTPPNHPPQRPEAAPPDTKRSTKSTQSQILLMACRAWADSAKM
jgi:hypothetical protein